MWYIYTVVLIASKSIFDMENLTGSFRFKMSNINLKKNKKTCFYTIFLSTLIFLVRNLIFPYYDNLIKSKQDFKVKMRIFEVFF